MEHDIIRALENALDAPRLDRPPGALMRVMLTDRINRGGWRLNMYTWSVFPMGNLNLTDDAFKDLRGKYLAYRFYEHKNGFEHGPIFDTWEEAEQWCHMANAVGHGEHDA